MKSKNFLRIRLGHILLGAAIVMPLLVVRGTKAGNGPIHLVTDWSHQHVVYSRPNSLIKQFQLSRDPRYVQQLLRRDAESRGDNAEWRWRWHHAPEHPKNLHGDWSMFMGSGTTVGAGNFPAKFSFDPTSANCNLPSPPPGQLPDFVVYATTQPGSSTQASIVAFDNLYTSCPGDNPTYYWSYDTGDGPILTSPVLSGDGTQVAFIENNGTAPGTANLVILRWLPDDVSPVTPDTAMAEIPSAYNNGSGTTCPAPCQTTIAFSTANGGTATPDSSSSPFYDFADDVLYVGDDNGFLHKFTGVFLGTPAEVVSSNWPLPIPGDTGVHLGSPVFDFPDGKVLVTDTLGYLYSADATLGASDLISSGKLASDGFDDAPLLDATTDDVYLFARGNNNGVNPVEAAVIRVPLSTFVDSAEIGTDGITEAIVASNTTLPVTAFFDGTFDNAYYTSANGTGNLYACGTNAGLNALWQVPITAGVLGTPVAGPTLTTTLVECSPITEFYDGTTDRMFLSVAGTAVTSAPIACPVVGAGVGCIMSFDITSPTWNTSTATAATTSVTGGSSGIVVDNAATINSDGFVGGLEQVYFTPLADQDCTGGTDATDSGTGGCAIQASQSGLD